MDYRQRTLCMFEPNFIHFIFGIFFFKIKIYNKWIILKSFFVNKYNCSDEENIEN